MSKKVKFYPIIGFEHLVIPPQPAKINIPKWYKKMPMDVVGKGPLNHTSKRCMPLLDSMTAGYYFFSYSDIVVQVRNGVTRIDWLHETEVIANHPREQVPGMPLPNGFYKDEAFKWFNPVVMKTPPGYSTLFQAPSLQHDLPFWCFPAIVDTDTYDTAIHFPFIMKKNWEGTITKGTPIIQAIPFKRDSWESEFINESIDNDKHISIIKSFAGGAYKKLWWNKKSYT